MIAQYKSFLRANVSLASSIVVSGLSQIVSSATSFGASLYLIRHLAPDQFGLYGIAFAAALLYATIGNAVFLVQMVANAPDKTRAERSIYVGSMFLSLLFFFAGAVILSAAALSVLWFATSAQHDSIPDIIIIVAFSICFLGRDFFLRVSYLFGEPKQALIINCCVAVTLVIGITIWEIVASRAMAAKEALVIFSIALIVGSLVGHRNLALPLSSVSIDSMRNDMSAAWANGKWALLGAIVTWLQGQAYVTITALMLGAAGVGLANGARMFVAPFLMLVPAIGFIIEPRLAQHRVVSYSLVKRSGACVTFGLLSLGLIYVMGIYLLTDEIASILLKAEYSEAKSLVFPWLIVLLVLLLRTGATMILIALREFQRLALTNVVSAIATLIASVALTNLLDVLGAIIALGLGEMILAIALWHRVIAARKP